MAPMKRGSKRLSEAEAAEYARYVEEDLEPGDLRPRPAGRPALGHGFPSPRIQVRVSRTTYQGLIERASANGTTLSALVRQLLEQSATK